MSYENIVIPQELGDRLKQAFLLRVVPVTLGELAESEFQGGSCCSPASLISETPTRHWVRFGDELLYGHCVLDILVMPSMREAPAEICSIDPISGEKIGFRLSRQGLEQGSQTLSQAVVSIGAVRGDAGCAQVTCCPFINLFGTQINYEQWMEQHPEVVSVVLPLDDAIALAESWLSARFANPFS